MNRHDADENAVAILGLAGRFPGAASPDELWQNLAGGVDAVRWFDRAELLAAGWPAELVDDPRYVRAGRVLDHVAGFDAGLFGIAPREAEIMDPQLRLLLECAHEALEDGGYGPGSPSLDEPRVGVFTGVDTSTYLLSHLLPRQDLVRSLGHLQLTLVNDKDFVASQIAYRLDLDGPAINVNTACSTSLVAVHTAVKSLLTWECDLALAGGAAIAVPRVRGYLYQEGGILSADGLCRAFDAEAGGTVHGNGGGLVLLKRLEDAIADGDRIIAVIRGSAVNNDGAARAGFTAPGIDGQTAVITEALGQADVEAESVSYVECHGTGTPLGDPIEIAALRRAFGTNPPAECAIGSVKTNLGHLNAAAGIAGLIKTVLMLRHQQIPPSLHFSTPNPACEFGDGPFRVATELGDWDPLAGTPRRAGVSSFGIGGTNAHVVLEGWSEEPAPSAPPAVELLTVSACTANALEEAKTRLARAITSRPKELAAAASTLRLGRRSFAHRAFAVASGNSEAAALLENSPRAQEAPEVAPPVVLLFPGQGAQHAGMLNGLLRFATFREALEGCSDNAGVDFVATFDGRNLTDTADVQPALLAIGVALAELWRSWGVTPRALLGHSLGEYTAAVVSGALSLGDGLRLVTERGRLMQALPSGAMLDVALAEHKLEPWLVIDPNLAVAALNAPSSSVVSGSPQAIERLRARLEAAGIASRLLLSDRAFHSPAVEPMLPAFGDALTRLDFAEPEIPWISNRHGGWITQAEVHNPDTWLEHTRQPVRFAAGVATLAADLEGVVFLEAGPGQVLTGLARQSPEVDPGRVVSSCRRRRDETDDEAVLLQALGRLWQLGTEVDWPAVDRDLRAREPQSDTRRRIALPTYPFERERYWIEPTPKHERLPLDSWFSIPYWRPAIEPMTPSTRGGWVAVITDADGVGEALLDRLAERGERAQPDEVAYSTAEIVVDLRLLDPVPTAADGIDRLLGLMRDLAGGPSRRLVVVTAGAESVAGEPSRPDHAFAPTLCRVAAQEFPHLRCSHIDLADRHGVNSVTAAADALLREIGADSPPPAVAWRGGVRWLPAFTNLKLPELTTRPRLLREGGVYLITGGFGRVGQVAAQVLAETCRPKLALLGRSAPPAGWKQQLEPDTEALALRADVTDRASLEAALGEITATLGPIDGVIHAAGQTGADSIRPLAETTPDDVRAQLAPKVDGLRHLAELIDPPPAFVVTTSSLSAVLGGLGLGAYAAANAILDAEITALRRSGGPTVWLSVDWDGWRFTDTRPGELQLTADEGANAWRRLLDVDHLPRVIVSTGDLATRIEQWVDLQPSPAPPPTSETSEDERGSLRAEAAIGVKGGLQRVWQELFGRSSIDSNADFFELGGTSLLAVRMVALARERLGVELRTEDVLSAPRLGDLAARISPKHAPERGWSPVTAVSTSGTRPPLFCVHGGGGALLSYATLAQALGEDQPFYGIQARGLEADHELFESLEEMAAFYVEPLRQLQPRGPYCLLGYCFGGLVALEIARRLLDAQEEVAFLGLIDTALPRVQTADSGVDRMDEVERLMTLFGDRLGIEEAQLRRRAPGERLEYLVESARRVGKVADHVEPSQAVRYLRLSQNHLELQTNFEPHPYPGAINYFRAAEGGLLRSGADPSRGWEQIAAGSLRVIDVPGDHWTMVEEPAVNTLAEAIKSRFE